MNIGLLQRYLIMTIIKSTMVVLTIAFAVDLFIQCSNEIRNIGDGNYTISKALLYVPMIIPTDLYSFFPMIGLLGVLIGLGALASSNELLVMRASGFSLINVVQAVFCSAFIIGIIAVSFGEIAAPVLSLQAHYMKQEAITGHPVVQTKKGAWIHVGDDFIHITRVLDRASWFGVTRYHFNHQNELTLIAWAKLVEYRDHRWLASSIRQTLLFHDHTSAKNLENDVWDISLKPDALTYNFDDAHQMSLFKLYDFIRYRAEAKLPLNRYPLDFWQRTLQPAAMLVMMLLAIPFVFVSARFGTVGVRVLMGVIVSLGFYLVSQLFGQISIVYRVPASLGASLPIILFFLLSVYLLRRVR
ncbi:MAG: LPS export ABC transporter permease LptG [Gammaproteobacteria bacterium]|nr:LPS export ABC transporter permease LptG [Gammaproteobacteria bacterium]MCD8542254.1 LPS export ABC transporter permease LptG [Gammaproteobacteria bacterium]